MPLDNTRDSIAFKKLLTRLCETMGKPFTDELCDAWWKALKHCSYPSIELRVDAFIAKAIDTTKFPRPAQMRDPDNTQRLPDGSGQNHHRGYWRSLIVENVRRELHFETIWDLEPVIVANKDSLGAEMLDLLNELVSKDHDQSHTVELQELCRNECTALRMLYADLAVV